MQNLLIESINQGVSSAVLKRGVDVRILRSVSAACTDIKCTFFLVFGEHRHVAKPDLDWTLKNDSWRLVPTY